MDARPLIAALPRDFALTLVDVGSAGGLNKRWAPFQPILSAVLFDPREERASGAFGRGATRTYPVALGEEPGTASLHLTALANMSSFLEPDPGAFAPYGKKKDDAAVVATERVPIERLDTLAGADGFAADVLKIDTQGSELQVLAGAETSLTSVLLAEIEVSFFTRYVGQPLFGDITNHMEKRGFELIDLLRIKRYRASNSAGIRNVAAHAGDRSGRAAYGNAIFLRRETDLLDRARTDQGYTLIRAIMALTAYGKVDMAARLLDQGREMLSPETANSIAAALRSLRLSGPGAAIAWLQSRLAG